MISLADNIGTQMYYKAGKHKMLKHGTTGSCAFNVDLILYKIIRDPCQEHIIDHSGVFLASDHVIVL